MQRGCSSRRLAPCSTFLSNLASEHELDVELQSWLAFAAQKVGEIRAIADAAMMDTASGPRFEEARAALARRRTSPRTKNPEVRARVAAVGDAMLHRASGFETRAQKQHARFHLPPLPTTTIGSFPQTGDVRGARAAWRAGRMSAADYDAFLKAETRRCVDKQEALGHRRAWCMASSSATTWWSTSASSSTGFAFTENGWVQSYGSRCVKPPVIYGDVARPRADDRASGRGTPSR